MEYVQLGKSGLKVSKIIFGTMGLGTTEWQPWVVDEELSLQLLKHAFDSGINTWDTADTYSHGRCEEILGKALRKFSIPRSKVVIMTKCYFSVPPVGPRLPVADMGKNDGNQVNEAGLSRKHILDAVEQSVARLGTYIDVLQIHRLDRETPKEEIMRALNDVIESGQVRYIGASSMAAWEFQMLQNIAEKHGWHKFISMQNYYNLLYREEEREMIPYCHASGVGLTPWSPLARGLLARPFDSRDSARDKLDSYLSLMRARETEADKLVVSRVEEIAQKRKISMATVATTWCLQKNVTPILGLNSIKRIDEAIQGLRFAVETGLSNDEMAYLEESYAAKRVEGF